VSTDANRRLKIPLAFRKRARRCFLNSLILQCRNRALYAFLNDLILEFERGLAWG